MLNTNFRLTRRLANEVLRAGRTQCRRGGAETPVSLDRAATDREGNRAGICRTRSLARLWARYVVLKTLPARVVERKRRVDQDDRNSRARICRNQNGKKRRGVADANEGGVPPARDRADGPQRIERAEEFVFADQRIPRQAERLLDVHLKPFFFQEEQGIGHVGEFVGLRRPICQRALRGRGQRTAIRVMGLQDSCKGSEIDRVFFRNLLVSQFLVSGESEPLTPPRVCFAGRAVGPPKT